MLDAIRAAHRTLARNEPVYRWRGPKTAFADPGDLIFSDARAEKPVGKGFQELADEYLLPLSQGRVGLLWDKSFLWGYIMVYTLRDLGFSFDLLTAAEVSNGALRNYQVVIVPGGWASLKCEALGPEGMEHVRRFVETGGSYLGICGGAGLALQVDEGLGLLPASRKPMSERLPNFSGSIRIRRVDDHPLWWGFQEEISFQVWWPSQFELIQPERIQVLGKYGEPESDFCVSDLNVQDAKAAGHDWENLEQVYEINMDPRRLLNEPAVLQGTYGKGRVVLSYPHLETPGDTAGNMALFNIWYDLLDTMTLYDSPKIDGVKPGKTIPLEGENLERVQEMALESEKLVALGESYDLWSWRNPWLLKWKRGIRGAEFGNISVLLQVLAKELEQTRAIATISAIPVSQELGLQLEKLEELWKLFQNKSRALLEEEARSLGKSAAKNAMELGTQGQALRKEIFNCLQCYGSKTYGGVYRKLLDQIDTLLLGALLADLQK
ncbi:MAG: BPL-N domain-containing protein [Syntrophobacterales bacterium]